MLLELLVSCITILLRLLLPHPPCWLQRNPFQWQRHCSTAVYVPNSQLSATRLTYSPMSVPKAICPISTSSKYEVTKKSMLVINLPPTTNGIKNMISVVCFRSEWFKRNLRKLPKEEGLLRHQRKSRMRVQLSRRSLHRTINILQSILDFNRLLPQDRQGDRRSLVAAFFCLMPIAILIPVRSSSMRKFLCGDLDQCLHVTSSKRKTRRSLPSWIKRSPSEADFDILGPDRPTNVDPEILNTPDNSKLKGVLWPGMHLFDAATAEMRRRRNQKKDGSTLMQMERTSKSVQPTEVIYSEGWTSTKQRPITGMVEDSSPLKGESPLPKKPVRRKRPALAEVSVNLLRNTRKPVKLEHPHGTYVRRGLDYLTNQSSPSLPSSSNGTSEAAKSRFSPTEDETMEFKLTVGDLVNRKKGGSFTIFQDKGNTDSTQLLSAIAGQRERAYPHFASRQMQSHLPQATTQIPFTTPSWLQPQYQQVQSYQNMYVHQGFGNPAYYAPQQVGPGKENVDPWFVRTGQVEQRTNPLGWNHHPTMVQNPYQAYNSFGYNGQNGFSGLPSQDDVFGYSANPLSAAYQTLQDHPESPFKTSETADLPAKPSEAKKGSISPDGTISERSGHDYDQSVFTTTE